MDIGSAVGRAAGVTEAQLRALADYRTSSRFSELERLVLDYAVAMTATPVDVPEAVFTALRRHFNDEQMIELTATIPWENYPAPFDLAREVLVQLHLTRDDLDGGVAVVVDGVGGLARGPQDGLERVRILLEHLAAGHHAGVDLEPVHRALLARDAALAAGEVQLAARLVDGVERPRRPGGHRVDVALPEREDRVRRREIHELDLAEVHAVGLAEVLDGHRDRRALGHADLQLLEVLGALDDLLGSLAEDHLLHAADVALRRDVVDLLAGGGDGHHHRGRGRAEVDVAGAPHARQIGGREVPADVDLEAFLLEVAELVGDGELRRHLRIAHEPGVDLGQLGLLRECVGGGADRDGI